MERLAYWLCSGLVTLGTSGASAAVDTMELDDAPHAAQSRPSPAASPATRIRYPLQVDGWRAVGEHVFEEHECGMSVRYAHGKDRDRWVDVYFYPAGVLSKSDFADAALQEVDMIREAHEFAGYEDSDIGALRDFSLPAPRGSGGGAIDGVAVDLAYAVDGTVYSSAMTLLLQREFFVKARFSIENSILSRDEAREQLLAFIAHLQPRVSIVECGRILRSVANGSSQDPAMAGLREVRLDHPPTQRDPAARPIAEDADAG